MEGGDNRNPSKPLQPGAGQRPPKPPAPERSPLECALLWSRADKPGSYALSRCPSICARNVGRSSLVGSAACLDLFLGARG